MKDYEKAVALSPELLSQLEEQVLPKVESSNPLSEYFRAPGLSIPLPSNGRWLNGELELNKEGKLEILPMRGADELLLKAPDALMSGMAMEQMLLACVPGIKNPNNICAPDLDVILLGIRAATYGNEMELEPECPNCEHVNSYMCDLPALLETIEYLPDDLDVRLTNDLILSLKPHTFGEQTKLLISAFKDARVAQMADVMEDGDDKNKIISDTYKNIISHQNTSITNAIVSVTAKGQIITNKDMIREFVEKASKQFTDKISSKLEQINQYGIDRNIPVKCEKCDHEWKTQIEFNPSSFFDNGS